MCGRFYIDMEIENIVTAYNLVSKKSENVFLKKGDIFPSESVPIITEKNEISMAKWGFSIGKNRTIINAKAETLSDKPLFRQAAARRRCLIPANAFYEWSSSGSEKKKYIISVKNRKSFFMAGIYNVLVDEASHEYKEFVIVTTEACREMSGIHNRMPVILTQENMKIWLDTTKQIKIEDILKSNDNNLIIKLDEESEQLSFFV